MKEQSPTPIELDQSGEYLSTKPVPNPTTRPDPNKAERDLLTDHLFFLYDRRETIFKDPKMFFAPVAVGHNLAYSGLSGFENPTLGIVMEWLDSCPTSHETAEDGSEALIYHLAGSPLSGCNRCAGITRDGQKYDTVIHGDHVFWDTWHAFMRINRKYNDQKETAEHYSLEEVISLLKEQGIEKTI